MKRIEKEKIKPCTHILFLSGSGPVLHMYLQTHPEQLFLLPEQGRAGYGAYTPFQSFPLQGLHAAGRELSVFLSSAGSRGGGHKLSCY